MFTVPVHSPLFVPQLSSNMSDVCHERWIRLVIWRNRPLRLTGHLFFIYNYEHLLSASSQKSPNCLTMATIALFSASEQTHRALVLCDSEWVRVALHSAVWLSMEVVTVLFSCYMAGATHSNIMYLDQHKDRHSDEDSHHKITCGHSLRGQGKLK